MDAYRHLVLDFSPGVLGGRGICHRGILSEKSEFGKTAIYLPCSQSFLFLRFWSLLIGVERQSYEKAGVTCGKRER